MESQPENCPGATMSFRLHIWRRASIHLPRSDDVNFDHLVKVSGFSTGEFSLATNKQSGRHFKTMHKYVASHQISP